MAVTPVLLVKTVTTAGTQVQVTTDTSIRPAAVYFETLGSNTGYIYIGDSAVSSTNYMVRLTPPSASSSPGFAFNAPAAGLGRVGSSGLQLSDLWVDSSVNGEKVNVTYMYETGG